MKTLFFYLLLPIIYIVSLLPFPILYLLSDLLFVVLYYFVGYRKKIVRNNLIKSFPEKSAEELRKIEITFYKFLCDLILETFKTLTISSNSALERCRFTKNTIAIFEKLHEEKKSCIIVMGHYGNWEWAGNTFSLICKQQLYVIYHPLSNRNFDRLIYNMRTRFGSKLYAMKDTMREMVRNRNEINATAFIADQTPSPDNAYWTTFLNQETPVFMGTEKIAQKFNYPVVYSTVNRVKRGFYEIETVLLFDESKRTLPGEISSTHTKKLEKDIITQPELWLWSHRRWKHKKSK